MHTFAPTVVMLAALMWPAAASAQSLGEVAQREAARRKAEASAPKTAAPVGIQAQVRSEPPAAESSGDVSLAEVARREAARRKALTAAGQRSKLLTNHDVKKWQPTEDSAPADASSSPESQKSGDDKSADKGQAADAQKDGAEPAKGEAYWHSRMTAAREDLRRNEAFAEALQSRINALSAEFSAKDDPYQRAQVADDRQKALAELDRLTADIDKNKKVLADIEEDARRAGVPAGWIR
jgi:hypothetical protein